MAEVSVDKVIEQLNKKFDRDFYVIWYDDQAEFLDNLDEIKNGLRSDIEILTVEKGESFKAKVWLHEHQDGNTPILVYAAYAKPHDEENMLLDFEKYASRYKADVDDMLRSELMLPEQDGALSFIKSHKAFFNNKERVANFKKYYSQSSQEVSPSLGIIAALLKFDGLRNGTALQMLTLVLQEGLEDNPWLEAFEKYDVLDAFWNMIDKKLGYTRSQPNLKELVRAMFLNYAYEEQMDKPLPDGFMNYSLNSFGMSNDTVSYLRDMADSARNRALFEDLGNKVWADLELANTFKQLSVSTYVKVDAFCGVDDLLLAWIKGRLMEDDFNTQAAGKSLEQVISDRIRLNDLRENKTVFYQYKIMEYARLLFTAPLHFYQTSKEAMEAYAKEDYKLDTYYRKFVFYNRQLVHSVDVSVDYNDLKDKIENYYVENFLDKSIQSWNEVYQPKDFAANKNYQVVKLLQRNFFRNYVGINDKRIVVIISDAFRFELAKELQEKIERNPQIKTNMNYVLAGLPSTTYMGMPALLPHDDLQLDLAKQKVLVDGKYADNLQRRAEILKSRGENNEAYSLDDVLNASSTERKKLFAGKKVVYIYHDEVDAHGDKAKTEKETFQGASAAIGTLESLIERMRTISVSHIIVTADHGFIYRDTKLKEVDKIDANVGEGGVKKQRYCLTKDVLPEILGVKHTTIGTSLDNDDATMVYYPSTVNVFKAPGSDSYTHGGSSLQELMVPVLDIKTSSNASVRLPVSIQLAPMGNTVTSLSPTLVFNQDQPVSDDYKPCDYKVSFVDEDGVRISNEATLRADSSSDDPADRTYRLRLDLRNQDYDRKKQYRLKVTRLGNDGAEESSDFIYFRMDIAISGNFNFDI